MSDDIVARMRLSHPVGCECLTCEAAIEIEHLRVERDEARREVCGMMHQTGFLAGDYARERGWDCIGRRFDMPAESARFGETLDAIHENKQTQIENLRGERDNLNAAHAAQIAAMNDIFRSIVTERDTARRELCQWSANKIKETAQDVARRHGWNCFELKQI